MKPPIYHEVQTLRTQGWLWTLVGAVMIAAHMPILYGMYSQFVKREPWGDKPMSDPTIAIFFVFLLACSALVILMLYHSKLEIEIGQDALRYRAFPEQNKWVTIPSPNIAAYEVRKPGIFEPPRQGRLSRLRRNKTHRLFSSHMLELKLSDDRRISLGTNNPSEVMWALKRMKDTTTD